MGTFRKFQHGSDHFHTGRPFQHWYRDNTVYFITARCRDRFPALESERAKEIFFDRFNHYTAQYGFTPWVTSLLDNHYHTVGYLRIGENLGQMMRYIHGSVAKLVNDFLPERRLKFWYDSGRQGYFDGCLRDEVKGRRTYRYVLMQSFRHRYARDWREYRWTVVNVELERAIHRAIELRAFMQGVPYARYARDRRSRDR
jgi:REP element-mobilizing transposase RayT